jgi:hypothetical protein
MILASQAGLENALCADANLLGLAPVVKALLDEFHPTQPIYKISSPAGFRPAGLSE